MQRHIDPQIVRAASLILWGAILIWFCPRHASANSSPLPDRYRDMRVFVQSAPCVTDPRVIQIGVEFHNFGDKPLALRASLAGHPELRFSGAVFEADLSANSHRIWHFEVTPPRRFNRVVLEGSIHLGKGENRLHARDLYIAMRGPDPVDFDPKREKTDRIEAAAKAVAVHAPATRDAIALRRRLLDARHKDAKYVTLAASGKATWSIDLSALSNVDLNGGFKASIDDFVRCVSLQSGAMVSVTNEVTNGPALRFVVAEKMPDGSDWPHRESSHIAVSADAVVVSSQTQAGLKHAVYELLTDDLGCRWFMPRELGEEIPVPADKTVRLRMGERRLTPSFYSTSGASWSNAPNWDRRNRSVVDGRMTFGHAWGRYISRSEYPYEEYPHYYARDREGNVRTMHTAYGRTNFCSTEPEVLDIVAKKVNEQLSSSSVLVASLDPEDYAPLCLCDRCLALDRSYGVEDPDGTFVTDRLLHFSKEIHDRLDEKNRDKFLGILVYAYQIELPISAKPHPQHAGMICNQAWTFDHTRPFNDPTSPLNRRFFRLVKGWGELLTQLGYYDYYGHWSFWGPWGMVHKMREDLPTFHDHGGTYLMLECQPNFASQGLNHYIAAQLSWNINADVDVLLDDFFTQFYGPAARDMRAYWYAGERHYALTRSGADTHHRVATRPGMWDELRGCLDAAAIAAQGADARYAERISMHIAALEYGRLRYEAEGRWRLRLHRPDHVNRDHMTATDLRDLASWIKQNRQRLTDIQKRFEEQADNWPTLTPRYFYPQFDRYLTGIDKRLVEMNKDDASAK